MDALILAAGKGTRLGLDNLPKCLIQFENLTLIEYQINCLSDLGIKNIFVVTGYNSEKIEDKLGHQVMYIHNKEFSTTNNIKSILLAKKFLKDDFVCMYGDLFFHKNILKKCIDSKNKMTLMVESELRDETTRVKIENSRSLSYEPFIYGWLNEEEQEAWGRPVDIIILKDGSMLISDDYANAIYRVSYEG